MDRGLPLINHLLQYTLRSLCADSQWIYAVFWRILPRNYPPPKWDTEGGFLDRNKGNKRNWILVWEDGFCDFSGCSTRDDKRPNFTEADDEDEATLQPELFFKMSHEIYNYGEGLIGKVAADNSHKWIYREPLEQEVSLLSPWQGSLDPYPRTWEAQFKAGIQTIAIVAVGEGLLQLGSVKKIMEDLNFVILLQRKFNYLQSVPGVFAPYPIPELTFQGTRSSETAEAYLAEKTMVGNCGTTAMIPDSSSSQVMYPHSHEFRGAEGPMLNESAQYFSLPLGYNGLLPTTLLTHVGAHERLPLMEYAAGTSKQSSQNMMATGFLSHNALTPSPHTSMSSLHALLSKLPSVIPGPASCSNLAPTQFSPATAVPCASKPTGISCCYPIEEKTKCSIQPVSTARVNVSIVDSSGDYANSISKLTEKKQQSGSMIDKFDTVSSEFAEEVATCNISLVRKIE